MAGSFIASTPLKTKWKYYTHFKRNDDAGHSGHPCFAAGTLDGLDRGNADGGGIRLNQSFVGGGGFSFNGDRLQLLKSCVIHCCPRTLTVEPSPGVRLHWLEAMVLMTIEADRSTFGPHHLEQALKSVGTTAYCLGLENQRCESIRGFKSDPLRSGRSLNAQSLTAFFFVPEVTRTPDLPKER